MDSHQIETLCSDLGPYAAEDVICRAMEELAQRMRQLQEMARKGADEELNKGLRTLAAIADQIGMRSLSRVAHDVAACNERGDRVARAACLARLSRMGEQSLTAMWELNEFSL